MEYTAKTPKKSKKGFSIGAVIIWSVAALAIGGGVGYGIATRWSFKMQPEPTATDGSGATATVQTPVKEAV